jgi:hypothetical protein
MRSSIRSVANYWHTEGLEAHESHVDVGSSASGSNLAVVTLEPAAVELDATAPPGTYYVRSRGELPVGRRLRQTSC